MVAGLIWKELDSKERSRDEVQLSCQGCCLGADGRLAGGVIHMVLVGEDGQRRTRQRTCESADMQS